MTPLLPVVAVAALAGLHDIRGTIPPPDLPPFAITAAVTLTAAGGVLSFAKRKRGESLPAAEDSDHVSQPLLRLRDDYDRGELPEALLFDKLSGLLRSMIAPESPVLTTDEVVAAARGTVPEPSLTPPSHLRSSNGVFRTSVPCRVALEA